jgi:hypothetical protein
MSDRQHIRLLLATSQQCLSCAPNKDADRGENGDLPHASTERDPERRLIHRHFRSSRVEKFIGSISLSTLAATASLTLKYRRDSAK